MRHHGRAFTLPEAIAAIAIAALALMVAIRMNVVSFNRFVFWRERLGSFLVLKSRAYETLLAPPVKKDMPHTIQYERPAVSVTAVRREISRKSNLRRLRDHFDRVELASSDAPTSAIVFLAPKQKE